MKCNKCKKIIPNQEEIREGNECFHEECAEIVKKEQEKALKTVFGWLIVAMVVVAVLGIILKWWTNRNDRYQRNN